MLFHTDLAMESRTFSGKNGEIPGVSFQRENRNGYEITSLEILDKTGEQELCKPIGKYITMETLPLNRRENHAMEAGQKLLAEILTDFLPSRGTVLVCGLGNANVTPDALGPRTVRKILATRHLTGNHSDFSLLRPVSVLETGVLGTTGLESTEIIRSVCSFLKPSAVLAIDALASAELSHVCCTVQISDAGIVPGSGVGNDRKELSFKTLGTQIIAVGVPTVMDAVSLTREISGQAAVTPGKKYENYYITPKNIDNTLSEMSKLIAGAVNLALQPGIGAENLWDYMEI